MSTRHTQIVAAIIARLSTVEAGVVVVRTGEPNHTYTWTLSAPGQVVAGRYEVPQGEPFACVYWLGTKESWGERLGDRLETGTFVICAWARATPMDASVRQADGESLAGDILVALRATPTLGVVRQFLAHPVIFDAVDPQKPDRAIWGAVLVEIEAIWTER